MDAGSQELFSSPHFEPLGAHHNRVEFDCGVPSLNDFLRQRARQNADRNLGVTHVAVSTPGDSIILGYYTMLVRSVERDSFLDARKLPPGQIGVALLARLAVGRSGQGKGLGTQMLLRAISQTERASRDLGIHGLVVHALDDAAKKWYLGLDFGFEVLTEDPLHLCLSVKNIRQLPLS